MSLYIFETDTDIVTLDLDTEYIVEWQCYSHGFDRWVSIELTDTLRDSPHYQDMKDKALEARSAEMEYMNGEFKFDSFQDDCLTSALDIMEGK